MKNLKSEVFECGCGVQVERTSNSHKRCPACAKAEIRSRARERTDPVQNRERVKAWRLANPERAKEADRKKVQRNPVPYRAAKQRSAEKRRTTRPEAVAEKARRDSRRRRARMRNVEVRPYSESDVFERDGWTCRLCGERIDSSLRFPDPMSKSIDHITPISLGGADTFGNVQATHLSCNCRKHNRVEVA